ncbi:MAG: caspase family protein [Pseudomonadota bacterium]
MTLLEKGRLFGLFVIFAVFSTAAFASGRVALIIGNSDYGSVPDLKNPANDSVDIAVELENLGYEVTLLRDVTRAQMVDGLRSFRNASLGAEHAIIYYAGHGIEIDKQNYLVPTDAALKTDLDVEYEAVPLDLVVGAASGATKLRLVILDACRDNPFLKSMTRSMSTRSIGRGLASVEPSSNTLVAYAAKDGTVASDGEGRNSPYANALLAGLRTPGLEVGKLFRQVRDDVLKATYSRQEPFVYGSLSAEDVYLSLPKAPTRGGIEILPVTGNSDQPVDQTPPARTDSSAEIAFWDSVKDSDNPAYIREFLRQFPNGLFAGIAAIKLEELEDRPNGETDRVAALDTTLPDRADKPAAPAVTVTPTVIRKVQAQLNILNLNAGTADGVSGANTRAAIRRYQERVGLPVNGEIDGELVAALDAEVSDSAVQAALNTANNARSASTQRGGNDSGKQYTGFCKVIGTKILNQPGVTADSPFCLQPVIQDGKLTHLRWYVADRAYVTEVQTLGFGVYTTRGLQVFHYNGQSIEPVLGNRYNRTQFSLTQ